MKTYSDDEKEQIMDFICEKIAEGCSVKKSIAKMKVPIAESYFFKLIADNPNFEKQYRRARETRADARFEAVDGLADKLESGKITSDVARVLIDTVKWQCGKEKAQVYGDSTQIKHADANGNKLTLSSVLAAIDGKTANLPSED